MQTLTQAVLNFIISYKSTHDGCAPSIREIGAAVGDNSTSHVVYNLDLLVAAGLIKYISGTARSIEVIGAKWLPPDESR